MIKEMRNQLSKPRRSISEDLTVCSQRYLVLGYERKRKYLKFKINNIVLQIIAREHIFDFHHRTGETCPAKRMSPDWAGALVFSRVNNFSSEELSIWWIGGGNTNTADRSWMKIMDWRLISFITIEDMGKQSWKTLHRFRPEKRRSSVLGCCKFW
jgi:hypothetical protein